MKIKPIVMQEINTTTPRSSLICISITTLLLSQATLALANPLCIHLLKNCLQMIKE